MIFYYDNSFRFSDVLYAMTYRAATSDGSYFSTYNPMKHKRGSTPVQLVTPKNSPILVPHETVRHIVSALPRVKGALLAKE